MDEGMLDLSDVHKRSMKHPAMEMRHREIDEADFFLFFSFLSVISKLWLKKMPVFGLIPIWHLFQR